MATIKNISTIKVLETDSDTFVKKLLKANILC